MKNSEINIQESNLASTDKKTFAKFVKQNPVLITVLISLVAITVVYFWKDLQAKRQVAYIKKSATEQLIKSNKEMLTVLSKPLVWSIRSEMLSGNLEKVNIYVKDIVKEKNFQLLQVIDVTGKIILSTDKKLEGKNATAYYDQTLLSTDSLKIKTTENLSLLMFAPIMGYDKKLGVLVIAYKPASFTQTAGTKE